MLTGVTDGTDDVAHAKLTDHLSGNGGGTFQVVGCAGVKLTKDDAFGCTAGKQSDQTRRKTLAAHRVEFFVGQVGRNAKRTATRNDRYLVYRITVSQKLSGKSVSDLMVGGRFLFLVGDHHALAFDAHDDLILGVLEVKHGHFRAPTTGGQQGSLVDEVGQVGTTHPGRTLGDHIKDDVLCQRHLPRVHLQNAQAARQVRTVDDDLTVETTRTKKGGVQHVRTVRRRDDDDPRVLLEAVHFHQQLVQRLLALIVSATKAGTAVTSHGIDLVDEHDARGLALGLFEEVTYAARANTDKHFYEVGTGDREEGHAGLTGHGTGKQRLTGTRRAQQKHTFGDLTAKAGELRWVTQEVDDLPQLILGLIGTGHILEGHRSLSLRQHPCTALAEREDVLRSTAAHLHAARQDEEGYEEQHPG